MSRRRSEECLSDLALDGLLVGALAEDAKRSAEAHLATCATCQARRVELTRDREEFLSAATPLRLPAAFPDPLLPPPRRIGGRVLGGAAALALAAAFAFFWMGGPGGPGGGDPRTPLAPVEGVATKGGGLELVAVVDRGGRVLRVASGDEARAGDKVQLAYSVNETRHLYVIGVDGSGTSEIYFPETGGAARVEPGSEVELPFSLVLDATPGPERYFGFFCDQPADPSALVVMAEGVASGRTSPPPAGCELRQLELDKR